jgi:phosphoribosyl-AMP cyclohydrolase
MVVDFAKMDGLIPAVVQDDATGDVLMLGYMNEEALRRTLETGAVTFYSRSREKLWVKGESSGHTLVVRDVFLDCDGDAIVARVTPRGPGVCHEGYRSCFFRRLDAAGDAAITAERTFDPKAVYGGAA